MTKTITLSLNDIPRFAQAIARRLKGGEILGLIGPLGSGKTLFVKRLAKALKIKDKVTSPTFVIMNVFPLRLPKKNKAVVLVHLDLYRTKTIKEIKALGLNEFWGRRDVITAIEWADKIKNHLPKTTQIINFSGYAK